MDGGWGGGPETEFGTGPILLPPYSFLDLSQFINKTPMDIDWKNSLDRLDFEKSLLNHKARRLDWSAGQKTVWVLLTFLLQFLVIAALYGGCAYNLVNNEIDLKAAEEEKMRRDWISQREEVGIFSNNIESSYRNNKSK